MPYDLENRLVIGLASSALFGLSESDQIFRTEGEESYRAFQRAKQEAPLSQGVAFPFIKRLLSLNHLAPSDPPVEVILLSKNDPDTGLRVMNSIKYYGLGITRAVFLQGRSPYQYIPALNISLFLSADSSDVLKAVESGYPAGQVLESSFQENPEDRELRIAFDFDGVLADDESETVFQEHDLSSFQDHEQALVNTPHNPGPLAAFVKRVSQIQKREWTQAQEDRNYKPILRISIVTARNAPAHERVINTMRHWNIDVNEAFFLGGIEKRKVLEVLKPHIFFDDQKSHLKPTASLLPSVHIPFGITNRHHPLACPDTAEPTT